VSRRGVVDGAHTTRMAEAADWLARITDPEATEQDFRGWQEWLAQDPAHASAYEEIERVWALSAYLPATPAQPSVGELALADIQQVPESTAAQAMTPVTPSLWRRVLTTSAAAIAAIAVVVTVAVVRDKHDVFETATAEQRSLRLTDGSQVVLGAETRVEVSMDEKRRSLEMNQGLAYFKVAHDKSRPFVVSGGGYAIEAVGTAFTVDTKPDRVVVTVTEGTVRVARTAGRAASDGAAPMLVHAGERALLDGSQPRCMAIDEAEDAALGWRDGRLEYMQEQLRFVIADVNRYSDRKIVFADPAIGRLEFTGTLFLEHIDEWLNTLQSTFPVTVTAQGAQRLVLQPSESAALLKALSSNDARSAEDDSQSHGC